jgi:hypothetical protein
MASLALPEKGPVGWQTLPSRKKGPPGGQALPREDLLTDATAFETRVELSLAMDEPPVVVGLRAGGQASFFFGDEPVYQFNSRGELRRAFDRGLLIKADRGQLVGMNRQRTHGEVVLRSLAWDGERSAEFLVEAQRNLDRLEALLRERKVRILRQVPADADVVGRLVSSLSRLPRPLRVAASPRVD